MAKVNGKEIQIVTSAGFNDKYGGIEATMYISKILDILQKHAVDMYIFETKDGKMSIKSAGYFLGGGGMDEETILWTGDSLPTETFWFKIDDYGDKYVGTFLFPSEY